MKPVERSQLLEAVSRSTQDVRVTALLGPRQCGKTTLARAFNVSRENYFDRVFCRCEVAALEGNLIQ